MVASRFLCIGKILRRTTIGHTSHKEQRSNIVVEEDGKPSAREVTLAGGEKIPVFTKPYENREVNEDDIFTGTVKFFDGRKGFGFLAPDEEISWEESTSGEGLFFSRDALIVTKSGKGMVLRLNGSTRVSYKVYNDKKGLGTCEIQNEDQTPLDCEQRKEKKGGRGTKRKRQAGGEKKSVKKAKIKEELIEERETDNDENVHTGIVQFYKPEKEYGFINISEDITFKGITVMEKIYVMKEDIVCCSDEVGISADSDVMFKIYKDSSGLGAYEVMNIDGTPIQYLPDEAQKEEEAVIKEPSPEAVKPVVQKKKARVVRGRKKAVKRRKKN